MVPGADRPKNFFARFTPGPGRAILNRQQWIATHSSKECEGDNTLTPAVSSPRERRGEFSDFVFPEQHHVWAGHPA